VTAVSCDCGYHHLWLPPLLRGGAEISQAKAPGLGRCWLLLWSLSTMPAEEGLIDGTLRILTSEINCVTTKDRRRNASKVLRIALFVAITS
jgi:hypothetical protein